MAKRASRRAMVRRESIRRGVTWAPTIPMAQRELRRTRVRRYRRHRQDVLIAILVVSLLLGTAVYYFGFDIVLMRGAGMSPTLRSGDRVLCIKQSLLDALQGIIPDETREVHRGDLVLMRYTPERETAGEEDDAEAPSALLIKRVTALGGDELDAGGGEEGQGGGDRQVLPVPGEKAQAGLRPDPSLRGRAQGHGIRQRHRLHDHPHVMVAVRPPGEDVQGQVDLGGGFQGGGDHLILRASR